MLWNYNKDLWFWSIKLIFIFILITCPDTSNFEVKFDFNINVAGIVVKFSFNNMENYNYNGLTEYEKVICFLDISCSCGCSKMVLREKFAELCEAFQAFSRSEKDIFLMPS